MAVASNHSAPKTSATLSIDSAVLSRARKLKINLSATLEAALHEEVRKTERQCWHQRHDPACYKLNALAEASGLFADAYRVHP